MTTMLLAVKKCGLPEGRLIFAILILAITALFPADGFAKERVRIVPQLPISDFDPVHVKFHPVNNNVLMVINTSGRVDILDIADPSRPVMISEIMASAESSAFSPNGEQVVTGGKDGKVRLWSRSGEEIATPFRGHDGVVLSVAFSPDGEQIISGGIDGTVRLWSLTGEEIARLFKGHEGWVTSVVFSPDGERILSGGTDGTVRLWSLTGQEVSPPLKGHEGIIWSVAFSPDGERITTGGKDGTIRLWGLKGEEIAPRFEGHEGSIYNVAFNPDGEWIVSSGADGTVRLWSLTGEQVALPFRGHDGRVWGVDFSPDGDRIISSGADGTVRLWGLTGEEITPPFKKHKGPVPSVAFSSDGEQVVSGGEDGTVRLWNLVGEQISPSFEGHDGPVWSVAFSQDGERILSGGRDGTVRLWNQAGKEIVPPFKGHEGSVHYAAFSPDGEHVVSGGEDGTLRLWNLAGEQVAPPFIAHHGRIWSVAFSPNGEQVVSGGEDGTVRLWNLTGEQIAPPFVGHEGRVRSVVFSSDGGRILSSGEDGTTRLWNLTANEVAPPFKGHDGSVHSATFSLHGEWIVSGGQDGTVRIWSLAGEEVVLPFKGQEGAVWSVAFSPDGKPRVATGGDDGSVRLWTLAAEEIAAPLKGDMDAVTSVAIDSEGKLIATGAEDGAIRLWNLAGEEEVARSFEKHQSPAQSVAFSPNGDRIASGGEDGTVRLWNIMGEEITRPIRGHEGPVQSIAFSPSGNQIVAGGRDGTVLLWSLAGEELVSLFKGHEDSVTSVAFSPDGEQIISGGVDGTVRLWNLAGKEVARPINGHEGPVESVAFSPDGQRIISGGSDEILRFWSLKGDELKATLQCAEDLGWTLNEVLWVRCRSRVTFYSTNLKPRGDIFLRKDGIAALLPRDGVFASTDTLHAQFRAIGEDGTIVTRRGAVPAVSAERARQTLFDEWTLIERVQRTALDAYVACTKFIDGLGLVKWPFILALLWTISVFCVLMIWLFRPWILAHWAMPQTGTPGPLPWWPETPLAKQLFNFMIFFIIFSNWLGRTRRPLRAWLRRHREILGNNAFFDRKPVVTRKRYCPLGNEEATADFCAAVKHRHLAPVWIDGAGGSGKSALAFHMAKRMTALDRNAPLPVLIDEDWEGALVDQAASNLRLGDRGPTPAMTRTLGAMGLLCPIMDSLSERSVGDAKAQVATAIRDGEFRSLIVTSRDPLPEDGPIWEKFETIHAPPLNRAQVSAYVATYAPPHIASEIILERLDSLLADARDLSPLFLRFAIEQAAESTFETASLFGLVRGYVEALRAGRADVDSGDFLRAAGSSAVESLREHDTPRELEFEYLRGVLQKEADSSPFMQENKTGKVNAAKLVDMQVASGLLNRNQLNEKLQFAYDPVAEQLAKWRWGRREPEQSGR